MKTLLSLLVLLATTVQAQAQNVNVTHITKFPTLAEVMQETETAPGEIVTDPEVIAEIQEMAANNPAACKIQMPRWSGSGILNGFDYDERGVFGAVISSNGHVTPRVGEMAQAIFMMPNGIARSFTCKVMIVAYSRTTTVDHSWLHCADLLPTAGILPVAMSKEKIKGEDFQTTGSPSGVWPLRTYDVKFQRFVAPDVPAFLDNAIGGQSGSGIRRRLLATDLPPKQYDASWSFNLEWVDDVKLTWSWNNMMAGQDTELIYRIDAASPSQRQAVINAAPKRPEGLIELSNKQADDRGIQEGYFSIKPVSKSAMGLAPSARVWSSRNLQVWYIPNADTDPTEPDPDDPEELTQAEIDAAIKIKQIGFDLVRLAAHYEGLMETSADETLIETSTKTPAWTPPPLAPGEQYTVGQKHNGRVLVQECVNGVCEYYWEEIR